MALTRMELHKQRRDELKQTNEATVKNDKEKKKLDKFEKAIGRGSATTSSGISKLNNKALDNFKKNNILASLNTDKLYSSVDSDKLKEAVQNIKNDIKLKNVEKTEIAILKKALDQKVDATRIITTSHNDRNSVTGIIREIEKGKEQKEISLERDKIALDNLRKQVNKEFEKEIKDTKEMYGEVFDDATMERIKDIRLQKLSEVHSSAAWTKITLTLLLLLVVFFITIILLKRLTGG